MNNSLNLHIVVEDSAIPTRGKGGASETVDPCFKNKGSTNTRIPVHQMSISKERRLPQSKYCVSVLVKGAIAERQDACRVEGNDKVRQQILPWGLGPNVERLLWGRDGNPLKREVRTASLRAEKGPRARLELKERRASSEHEER